MLVDVLPCWLIRVHILAVIHLKRSIAESTILLKREQTYKIINHDDRNAPELYMPVVDLELIIISNVDSTILLTIFVLYG